MEKRISLSTVFVCLMMVVGAFLLTYDLSGHCFWTDESFSLRMASKTMGDLIASVYHQDPHPPLYYILLKLWCAVFSYTIIPGVLFSVIFGFAAASLGCYLYKLLFDDEPSIWIPASLIFTSGFFVMFTRMIRYYAYVSFLVVVLLIVLVKFVTTTKKRWWWILLCMHIILIYSDYPASTIFAGEVVALFVLRRRFPGKFSRLFIIQIITLLVFFPWLSQLLYHMTHLSSLTKHAALSSNLTGVLMRSAFTIYDFLVGQCIYPWQAYITLPLMLLHTVALCMFFVRIKSLKPLQKSKALLVVITVLVSMVMVIGLSSKLVGKQSFVYISVRMMYCFIPIMVIGSRGFAWFDKYKYHAVVLIVIFNMFVLHSYYNKLYYINPLYAIDWETVVNDVNERIKPGDIIISDESEVVRYYAKNEILNAHYFYDDKKLGEFILSHKHKKDKLRFFVLLTERDSTESTEFDKEFIDMLLKKGMVSVRKDYTPVSPTYYKLKKQLTGRAYGHKLHLFVLELPLSDIKTYFQTYFKKENRRQ